MTKKKARVKSKPKTAKNRKSRKPAKTRRTAKRSKTKRSATRRPVKVSKAAAASKAPSVPRPGIIPPTNGILLGFVEDYFAKIGVIALTLKTPAAIGQRIQVLGHTTNFEETIDSMQIEHAPVQQAGAGDSVGIKVIGRARAGDHVYLLR